MKLINADIRVLPIFLLPGLIGFCIFYFIPFFMGIYYSLLNNNMERHFVGFKNYIEILKNPVFLKAASNSFIFSIISVPLLIILSLSLALLVSSKKLNSKIRVVCQTIIISPLVIPTASVVLIWQLIFDNSGALNSSYSRFVIVSLFLWKNSGYSMILFIGGLNSIPKTLYEAASIDGAGKVRQFISITLVWILPSFFFIVTMAIINSFKVYREIFLIAGQYPHQSIYLLQHFLNNTLLNLKYQKLTSASVLFSLIVSILVIVLWRSEKKITGYLK